jgi:hypothetical protein
MRTAPHTGWLRCFEFARIQHGSKLLGGFQARQQGSVSRGLASLDGQALAAFGAACIDHSAATFGFHTHEKAMGAGAAGFGGLISTFHDSFIQSIAKIARRF